MELAVVSKTNEKLGRRERAAVEIGHTQITRAQKWALILAFLGMVFAVPTIQNIHEIRLWRAGRRDTPWPRCLDIFASLPAAGGILTGQPPAPVRTSSGQADDFLGRVFQANAVLLHGIHQYEDALAEHSFLTQRLVPPVQELLAGLLGAGNEQAYLGREDWLFYRPGVDYLTGPGFLDSQQLTARARSGSEWLPAPQPDPLLAIFQFHGRLAERNIQLVLVPAPVKPVVQMEMLSARYRGHSSAVENLSYRRFLHNLEHPEAFFRRYETFLAPYRDVPEDKARKSWYWPLMKAFDDLKPDRDVILASRVLVFDPTSALVGRRVRTGRPQYLETDTHWRPETVEHVAERLKAFLEEHVRLPAVPSPGYRRLPQTVTNLGDITVMMKLPAGQTLFPMQQVTIHQVVRGNNLWRPDPNADVLLLGDSFSNVYSLGEMGWGEGAGLAEQLSFVMQRPLDVIIRNDAGARSTREMLSRELARGYDRLAEKRVVIWQFANRELAVGDWRVDSAPMRLGSRRQGRFLELAPGQNRVVAGVVREISAAPRPGTVPYSEHVIYMHLANLKDAAGTRLQTNDALVAMYSMRNNVWTRAARYRPGQEVTVRLRNYDDVNRALKVESLNSTELQGDASLETPCWGEELDAPTTAADAGRPDDVALRFSAAEILGLLVVLMVVAAVIRFAETREPNQR